MTTSRIHPDAHRNRFAQHDLPNKIMILSMIGTQALCQRGLRYVSARRLHKAATRVIGFYRALPVRQKSADTLIENAEIAHHLSPWNSECVAESLVLWSYLRANGYPAQLRIGCRNILGPVEAHMWVELDGRVLLDVDHESTTWRAFREAWPPDTNRET